MQSIGDEHTALPNYRARVKFLSSGEYVLKQTASEHCLRLWGMKPTVLDQRNLLDLHLLTLTH